jgi:hypothetical protein
MILRKSRCASVEELGECQHQTGGRRRKRKNHIYCGQWCIASLACVCVSMYVYMHTCMRGIHLCVHVLTYVFCFVHVSCSLSICIRMSSVLFLFSSEPSARVVCRTDAFHPSVRALCGLARLRLQCSVPLQSTVTSSVPSSHHQCHLCLTVLPPCPALPPCLSPVPFFLAPPTHLVTCAAHRTRDRALMIGSRCTPLKTNDQKRQRQLNDASLPLPVLHKRL